MSKEFKLTGGVDQVDGVGPWCGEIVLSTSDGRVTRLFSGYIFATESEAKASVDENIEKILCEFKKDGVEIISKNGRVIQ